MQWLANQIGSLWSKIFENAHIVWTSIWRWAAQIWMVVGMVFTLIALVLLHAASVLGQLVNAVIAGSFSGEPAAAALTHIAFVNSIVPLYEGSAFVTLLFAQRLILAAYRFAKSWLPTLTGA